MVRALCRGRGTWRFIKYSDTLVPRHTKYSGLGAKASEYFMNRQVISHRLTRLEYIMHSASTSFDLTRSGLPYSGCHHTVVSDFQVLK